jgi:hypothetical protein
MSDQASLSQYPPGDYAIVELFGHTTLVGRIEEVERFGTKMLAIEPLFCDTFLPAVFHGGAAIYRLTPCPPATAFARQARHGYQIPPAIRCIIPELLLATPSDAWSPIDGSVDSDPDED